jgi:hypothetical protein
MVAWNMLKFLAFYQALMTVASETTGFFPRDAAFGLMSREQYLDVAVVSKQVYRPVRRAIEEHFPGRGVVYVYGDDKGYYLSGRVGLDYELGSSTVLWRMAAQCRDAPELRKKVRERGWTHFIYSTYWPDFFENEKSHRYRFDGHTIRVVQEFWRAYAAPELVLEMGGDGGARGSYVFSFRRVPSGGNYIEDGCKRLPFLPGVEALFLGGDRFLQAGNMDAATAFFGKWQEQFPDCVIINDRLARIALARGLKPLARAHLRLMMEKGWDSPYLRRAAGM